MPKKPTQAKPRIKFSQDRRRLLKGLIAAPLLSKQAFASKTSKANNFDTVVIGAGVFGAWTAWHLSKAGQSVALVDAWGPGNTRSSSGGESRVIRTAYGPDLIYSEMAKASLLDWQALSQRQSRPIFHKTGVLWISSTQDKYIDSSLANLKKLQIPSQLLDRQQLLQRYPQINLEDIKVGLWEPSSGALLARRGVQAVVQEAIENGTQLSSDSATAPEYVNGKVQIKLTSGNTLTAENAVYACGAWLAKVFPEIIGSRILSTRQIVYFFGTKAGDTRFSPPTLPVWADFNSGDVYYGIPDIESRGFKIAHDAHGPEFDPDRREPLGSHRALEVNIRTYLQRRFPDLADAPLLGVRFCQYENSSSGDYLIDRHPHINNVWLAGGGSGHGFKNGPAVGARVASGILGRPDYKPVNKFLLEHKKTRHKRVVI